MPVKTGREYYEVLGVTRQASLEEIKKRYRELARQFHPDVNPNDPDAAQRFSEVSAAYRTLSDTDNRATYDAELLLKDRQSEKARQATAAAAAQARATMNQPRPSPKQTAAPQTPAQNGAQALAERARTARQHNRFVEAKSLAEQAIRMYRKNPLAYEVLGDIYRLQGKNDDAINMYTVALQLNPANQLVRQSFERIIRNNGGSPSTSTAQKVFYDNSDTSSRDTPLRPAPLRSPARTMHPQVDRDKAPLLRFMIGFVGFASVIFLMLYQGIFPGEGPQSVALLPFVSTWNTQLFWMLIACGMLSGVTLALSGCVNRIDEELILVGSGRTVSAPLGLVLIVLALINFWAGAAIYAAVSSFQESFTRSLKLVFLVTAFIVLGMTLAYSTTYFKAWSEVLIWGGNVVFLSLIIGWLLGDVFRPVEY
jgi:tetratricopeptide (TPR) repeat protein